MHIKDFPIRGELAIELLPIPGRDAPICNAEI
jgi:hypothetical protein